MADAKTKVESIREWVVEHKLRTVGCLWLSGITGSVAYNWSKPNMKPSVKIIHASQIEKYHMIPDKAFTYIKVAHQVDMKPERQEANAKLMPPIIIT
ncbi:hypoxia-responsive family protein [Salix suchowensis]|nr:hypoxia-responsive family protein [Salix suchowensis]